MIGVKSFHSSRFTCHRGPSAFHPRQSHSVPAQSVCIGTKCYDNFQSHSSRDSVIARFKITSELEVQRREEALATRKKYLTNFWYAATFSKCLSSDEPVRTKLLDTDVLLWRDPATSKVVCITAVHPDTNETLPKDADVSLCQRETKEGSTETAISIDGQLYWAASGAPLASEALPLEVWDCREKGGFIWMFFGDRDSPEDSRPAIPWVPELNKPGWNRVHGEVFIKANHWMVMENVIDMAHVPYVHSGTVGDHAEFVDIIIKMKSTAMFFDFPIVSYQKSGDEAMLQVDVRATACLPSTSLIRFKIPNKVRLFGLPDSFQLVTINSVVPIDENTTCIRFCSMRDFLPNGLIDKIAVRGMKNILDEDRVILEQLTPHAVTAEVSLKADAPQLALRKMRGRYIRIGAAVPPGRRPLHSMPRWSEEFGTQLEAARKAQERDDEEESL